MTDQVSLHAGGNVLLVDDEPDIRELCRINLEIAGWSVRDLSGAGEVAAAIETRRPDAIVLDLRMPGVDGWAVLAGLRSTPASLDIPVILLSADGDAGEVLDCWEAGLLELLEKPFIPRVLVEAVARAGQTDVDPAEHAARVCRALAER